MTRPLRIPGRDAGAGVKVIVANQCPRGKLQESQDPYYGNPLLQAEDQTQDKGERIVKDLLLKNFKPRPALATEDHTPGVPSLQLWIFTPPGVVAR